jgi:hypothetical protein
MDEKTFRMIVSMRKPPEVGEESLAAASDFFVEQGDTQERHVSRCIQLAGRFENHHASSQENAGLLERRLVPLTPGMLMISDDLTGRITPEVEHLRQELFENTHAPFSSKKEAALWIEQQGQQQDYTLSFKEGVTTWVDQTDPQRRQQLEAIRQEIEGLYRQWTALTGETVRPFSPNRRFLPYVRPSEKGRLWPEEFPVCAGSPLAKLYEVSHKIAQATGFAQQSVVTYILTGTKPLLSPLTVHIHRMGNVTFNTTRVQAVVECNTPDVTDEQLRAIRREIRHAWEAENTKLLSEDDRQLLSIVERFGDVPQRRGDKKPFWEKVCQERNRLEHGKAEEAKQRGTAYTPRLHRTWKSTRMAHGRLTNKLKKLEQGYEEGKESCPAAVAWKPTIEYREVISSKGMESWSKAVANAKRDKGDWDDL